MANCKKDFLDEVGTKIVKCAKIERGKYEDAKVSILPFMFTKKQWIQFLADINYQYDDGYGVQEVFGTIWYKDGTWSERAEYDGSEWWAYKSCPPIPGELPNN
jgi:hypothetical protein